jgi:hypothetical protein
MYEIVISFKSVNCPQRRSKSTQTAWIDKGLTIVLLERVKVKVK